MSTPDNPPAFPHDARDIGKTPSNGMTLRDYFAAKIIAGMPVSYGREGECARRAYQIADAMLETRQATPSK